MKTTLICLATVSVNCLIKRSQMLRSVMVEYIANPLIHAYSASGLFLKTDIAFF